MESRFKLIAIRPLEGCSSAKVLEIGRIYHFCNDILISPQIDSTGNQEINIVKKHSPIDLYSQEDININVSAIVGENGSGKSTIIELLAIAINNIVYNSKRFKDDYENGYGHFHDASIQLFVLINNELWQIYSSMDLISFSIFKDTGNGYEKLKRIDGNIDYNNFFYTFLANYSLYGLNERDLGPWIYSIFHKNDGYQVPLNIYPLRSEGNININNETHLTKNRLFSNLLIRSKEQNLYNRISDNQKIIGVLFKRFTDDIDEKQKKKRKRVIIIDGKEIFYDDLGIKDKPAFLQVVCDFFGIKYNSDFYHYYSEEDYGKDVYSDACNYVIRKLVKITAQHEKRFWKYFDGKGLIFKDVVKGGKSFKNYLEELKADKSVITLKLRQALNFLDNWDKWSNDFRLNNDVLFLKAKIISDLIYSITTETKNFIEFIPPPIYDIDFVLAPISIKDDDFSLDDFSFEGRGFSYFKSLSSGEKQLIFSVNSVLYHLVNLNSIHSSSDPSLINYKYANLLFDEIELYFHPEYQRRYLNELLNGIKRINIPSIKGINICFATHSPFILSDIPELNCMFLEVDKSGMSVQRDCQELNDIKTFGANIHELLRNGFFMENGTMGEFAKSMIIDVLSFLENVKKGTIEEGKKQELKKKYKLILDIIGEPVIKSYLTDYWHETFEEPSYEELLEKVKKYEANKN